jgi:hypothetical protein
LARSRLANARCSMFKWAVNGTPLVGLCTNGVSSNVALTP